MSRVVLSSLIFLNLISSMTGQAGGTGRDSASVSTEQAQSIERNRKLFREIESQIRQTAFDKCEVHARLDKTYDTLDVTACSAHDEYDETDCVYVTLTTTPQRGMHFSISPSGVSDGNNPLTGVTWLSVGNREFTESREHSRDLQIQLNGRGGIIQITGSYTLTRRDGATGSGIPFYLAGVSCNITKP